MRTDGRAANRTAMPDPSIAELIAARQANHALPQAFYVREAVFAADLDLLCRGWTCLGHASDIAAPGDWITGGFGRESAIIVRGEDGQARAFANVCRHRGSRICAAARGSGAMLTCPYHAWTYRLDGTLRAAREMDERFEPAAHALVSLPLAEIGGLMFVSFNQRPNALDAAADALAGMTGRFGWAKGKIAARRSYAVAANWKLALENYHECYHCGPAHPEFSILHALARPGARTPGFEAWDAPADGSEPVRVMTSELARGALTGSRDGRLIAPPMAEADGTCVFAEVGYLSAFLAYADHGVIYRFMPRDVLLTEMEVIWLVAGEAADGHDYDVDALTWLWDVTSLADKRIIETNQAGVLSRFYRPGPFSLMEPGSRQFVDRYLADLAAVPPA